MEKTAIIAGHKLTAAICKDSLQVNDLPRASAYLMEHWILVTNPTVARFGARSFNASHVCSQTGAGFLYCTSLALLTKSRPILALQRHCLPSAA